MAWTAEDRRKYAPAIQEVLRQGMLVRLAATIDTIDPPCETGRPRDWSTVTVLGALWHLARDGCVWRRLPVGPGLPPHRSVWSRFLRWRLRAVPADVQDRDALAALAPDLAAHPSLLLAWTDLGFAAERCGELLARHGVVQELVGTVGRRGFVVEPRRWKVEQTLGRLQRYRRLRVDDEMSNETSRHMTILASLFMTGMRFERMLRA